MNPTEAFAESLRENGIEARVTASDVPAVRWTVGSVEIPTAMLKMPSYLIPLVSLYVAYRIRSGEAEGSAFGRRCRCPL